MSDVTWVRDAVPQEDGTVGGDGASRAWSVRFTSPQVPGAIITEYWYAVDLTQRYDDAEERFEDRLWDVENQTEYLVCTDMEDPGGTEVWSDVEYEMPSLNGFRTEEDADAYARAHCARSVAEHYAWDGQPR